MAKTSGRYFNWHGYDMQERYRLRLTCGHVVSDFADTETAPCLKGCGTRKVIDILQSGRRPKRQKKLEDEGDPPF